MDVFDCILDGLEKALELERELGVRTVELDRTLLATVPSASPSAPPAVSPSVPPSSRPVVPANNQPPRPIVASSLRPLAFLHDRPLSPKGTEMMAKIVEALGLAVESAPVVVAPPVPNAKILVVLGGLALKKCFPELRGEPGQWLRTPEGKDVLVTYSPEYILRFATVTPAVLKIKQDMWRSLKAVKQRMLLV